MSDLSTRQLHTSGLRADYSRSRYYLLCFRFHSESTYCPVVNYQGINTCSGENAHHIIHTVYVMYLLCCTAKTPTTSPGATPPLRGKIKKYRISSIIIRAASCCSASVQKTNPQPTTALPPHQMENRTYIFR